MSDSDNDSKASTSETQTIDPRLQAVTKVLRGVEPPGDFFFSGVCTSFPPPAIVVDGLGEIALPVLGDAAKALVDKCHLAPLGDDTQVRNPWELSTSQFHLENAAWHEFIQDEIVPEIHLPLGIDTSVDVEAKLCKMVLYEAGGNFEKHLESEKEDGVFATLLVVLPGGFEGGELTVFEPLSAPSQQQQHRPDPIVDHTKSHVWDPASMDPHTLKYAVFYGDCPHDVKPVTKGYRLCLTYNLVTDASAPRFGANHALYATLKTSLCAFFSRKQLPLGSPQKYQRLDETGAKKSTDFDLTDPQSYRATKFVYVLDPECAKAGLSFQYLNDTDALVAASLAAFCKESEGALCLFLCKMKYRYLWEGPPDMWCYDSDNEEFGETSKVLTLFSPWVENTGFVGNCTKTGTERCIHVKGSADQNVRADVWREVAPAGMFEYMDDDDFHGKISEKQVGSQDAWLEKWYSSLALVVMPFGSRVQCQFRANAPAVLDEWLEMAHTNPRHARAIAAAIRNSPQPWSLTSDKSLPVLESLQKFKDIDMVRDILMSCAAIEFQPKLRGVVQSFCHEAVASMLTELSQHWAGHDADEDWIRRNRVNLVASVLHGETDATSIKTILKCVEIVPTAFELNQFDCMDYFDGDTMPDEYVRVLVLASFVSVDRVKSLLDTDCLRTLVLVVAPVVVLFQQAVKSSGSPLLPDQVRGVVCAVEGQLTANMAAIRNQEYARTNKWRCHGGDKCSRCTTLETFLKSLDESTLLDKMDVEYHLQSLVDKHAQLKTWLRLTPCADDDAKMVVAKTFESNLYCMAKEQLATLTQLRGNTDAVGGGLPTLCAEPPQ